MANWTPNDITTELWFDADDASTITESGGVVSQWNDKSPNAAHAAAAIVGDRPTTNAQTLNGKNVVAFNEHVLEASAAFLNGKTSLGAIVVFDNQNSAIQNRGIFSTKVDVNDIGFGIRTDSAGYVGGGTNVYKIACSTTDGFNNCELSNQSATLDPSIIAMRWDAGLGMRARIDGTINTFTSDTSTNIGTTTDMASFFIGQGAGTGRAIGNYAELIVFDGLSDEDVERLEGYVAHKWGLTANLPSNHPYKTEAPQRQAKYFVDNFDAAKLADFEVIEGSPIVDVGEFHGKQAIRYTRNVEASLSVAYNPVGVVSDYETVALIRLGDTASNQRFGPAGSLVDNEMTGYAGNPVSNNALFLTRYDNNSRSNLASDTNLQTESDSEWVWYRFRKEGNDLKAKAWAENDPEPTAWDCEFTETTPLAAGKVGLLAYALGNVGDHVAAFGVGLDGETAPTDFVIGSKDEPSSSLYRLGTDTTSRLSQSGATTIPANQEITSIAVLAHTNNTGTQTVKAAVYDITNGVANAPLVTSQDVTITNSNSFAWHYLNGLSIDLSAYSGRDLAMAYGEPSGDVYLTRRTGGDASAGVGNTIGATWSGTASTSGVCPMGYAVLDDRSAPIEQTLEHDFEIFLNFEDTNDREKDITSNATAVTNHLVTYTNNALGNNVADFVGSNAYLDYSAEAARFASLDQVAVSIDFRPNVVSGVQVVCGWSDSTVLSTDLLLFIQNGDLNLQLRVNNAQRWKYTVVDGVVADTNYNVCFSCGSEGPKLWIDGVLQDHATHLVNGTAASTESLSHFSPDVCRVGASKDSNGDEFFFDGHVKDFVVANAQFDQNTVDDIQAGFYGYELLALWGQSNAVGRATLRGGTDDNYTKVSGLVDQYGYSGQTITAATNPLDHVNEQSNDMGLWLSLCNELVDILPYKRRILLAPMAQGGTGFETNHWNAGNALYEAALSRTNAALAQNRLSRISMMHWLQGETDADNGNTTYLADLTAMQSDAYNRLNGYDASTPFVCVSILGSSIPANVAVINTDLQAFADGAANRHYVDATDLNLFDQFHYDAASLDTIGLRSFNAVYGTQSGGSTVSSSFESQWNLLEIVNNSIEARFNILQAVSNSASIDWNTLQAVLSSASIDWTILNGTERSLGIEWNMFGAIVGELGINWNLLQAASSSFQLDWNTLQQTQSGVELRFNVLEQASRALGIQFNILSEVGRSVEIRFNNDGATNQVNSALSIRWSLFGAVERALSTEWNLLESVGVSVELRSDIAQAVAQAVELEFNVSELVERSASIVWDSIEVVNGSISLRWSIALDSLILPIHQMIVVDEERIMTVFDEDRT